MNLNVKISQETYEKLKRQAQKTEVSVEAVAGDKLSQVVSGVPLSNDVVNDRWNKGGKSWSRLSADEFAECYRGAYLESPASPDELAWHEDDVSAFEERGCSRFS